MSGARRLPHGDGPSCVDERHGPHTPHPRRTLLLSLHRCHIVPHQVTAQRAQPEAEAPLDRAEGDALRAGDLRVGVARGVGEGERRALGSGQADERVAHELDLGVLAGQFVRVSAVGDLSQGRDIDPAVVVAAVSTPVRFDPVIAKLA